MPKYNMNSDELHADIMKCDPNRSSPAQQVDILDAVRHYLKGDPKPLKELGKAVAKKKVKVFKGTEDEWLKTAANLAFSYVQVHHCSHCDYPVIEGYCCSFCGSEDPGSVDDEPDYILGFD